MGTGEQGDRPEEWRGGAFLDLMPDAIVAVDARGAIRELNDQLTAMFGYSKAELLGRPIEVLLPERFRAQHVHHRVGYQAHPHTRPMGVGIDLYGLRKDGSEIPIDIMLSPISVGGGLVLAVVRDITAMKKSNEQLRRMAFSDLLTDLPNRAAFYRDLNWILLSGSTSAAVTAIALFDLDGFKDVNDTLGHSTGDRLLIEVARRWKAAAGDAVRIYRLGGDEFVSILPVRDNFNAAEAVERLLKQFDAPFEVGDKVLHIGASAGVAVAPADGSTVEALLANADLALYRAKASGRGTYAAFHPAMRAESEARRNLEIELREAFRRGDFELYYQPQIRLCDGRTVGAEALLRWRHGTRGVISPNLFLDTLAASPFAPEVGRWILRTACRSAASWAASDGGPMRVAVNLFPVQFRPETLVRDVEDALEDSGLPGDRLELEITENIALNYSDAMIAPLLALRDKGVCLAFDDFGTGYGSLSFLTRIPLSHIKIDGSFVRKIPDDAKHVAIVGGLIGMAHNIGLKVIAEGVELPIQAEFLRQEKCDEAQGFLFARPMPAAQFDVYLRERGYDIAATRAAC